ncbi:MAG: GWxTD domain-containing protein, partial [Acidobacteria bacterium]|nr:GWxTD domain-containing protein [Acidobacteriota bacterium]
MRLDIPPRPAKNALGCPAWRRMKNAALSFLSLLFLAVSWTAGPAGLPASQKKSADRKQESLADYFRQWLEKDVKYIITEDEKAVFQQLTADEEREQFVEQFWHRRDTDPTTPENEFKIEHYRRIQYANDVFAAGIPGWMTDRGRIYIKFGAPDRLQTYAGGSGYERPWQEGGGRTVTHPFERWEYRHIEGIGDDIEIEFVDYSGGNLYKISHNPIEKDMMLHVP